MYFIASCGAGGITLRFICHRGRTGDTKYAMGAAFIPDLYSPLLTNSFLQMTWLGRSGFLMGCLYKLPHIINLALQLLFSKRARLNRVIPGI